MQSVELTTSRGLPLIARTGKFSEFPESVRHYIVHTWVARHIRSIQTGGKQGRKGRQDRLRVRIENILSLPTTRVVVTEWPGDEAKDGRIIGFAIAGGHSVVHYIYVRRVYRHGGAGQLMLGLVARGRECLDATHWSKNLPVSGELRVPLLPSIFYVGFDRMERP